jgi:hypothetical protein
MVEELADRITKQGVAVCYFRSSSEAIDHSRSIGLVTAESLITEGQDK